jgi:hypothetical protein
MNKLNIPEIGDVLELTSKWEFTLHLERRNLEFGRKYHGVTKSEIEAYNKWRDWYWYGWDYNTKTYIRTERLPKPDPKPVTLPKGTLLKVDRIYIRRGNAEFSSVTFRIPNLPKSRFWAKLSDVNNIKFRFKTNEPVANMTYGPYGG